MSKYWLGWAPLCLALVMGCGDSTDPAPGGGGGDASADTGAPDASIGPDGSLDAAADAGSDAAPDAGVAAVVEGSLDVPLDIPDGAQVALVWIVSSGSPDYEYVWGTTTLAAEATRYRIELDGPPPEEALNAYRTGGRLGVATAVLVWPEEALAEGRVVDSSVLDRVVRGFSPRAAVIYRRGTLPAEATWPSEFPDGAYGCGQCVDAASGFDSYAPAACDAVDIVPVGPTADWCEWT